MNYTKGEWKVGKATDVMGYETPIYANTDEGRDYEIATVHIYNGEQIANAQLIASAPDLYEALKTIVELKPFNYHNCYLAVKTAEQALAKNTRWK